MPVPHPRFYVFGSCRMWAGAHEMRRRRHNTVGMSLQLPASSHTGNTAPASSGVTVSQWFDASTNMEADLSREVAGKKVVSFASQGLDGAVMYEPGIDGPAGPVAGRTPGFLFTGDDGDSLWFWPEGETVAFRFEPGSADALRGALSEHVHRLVCQGALVFCYEERLSDNGDPVFRFPELGLRSAAA